MTSPARPATSHPMEWIITFALTVAVFVLAALAAVFVLRTKRHNGGSLPGHFHFDRYKLRELSTRGLFDKTKWH